MTVQTVYHQERTFPHSKGGCEIKIINNCKIGVENKRIPPQKLTGRSLFVHRSSVSEINPV